MGGVQNGQLFSNVIKVQPLIQNTKYKISHLSRVLGRAVLGCSLLFGGVSRRSRRSRKKRRRRSSQSRNTDDLSTDSWLWRGSRAVSWAAEGVCLPLFLIFFLLLLPLLIFSWSCFFPASCTSTRHHHSISDNYFPDSEINLRLFRYILIIWFSPETVNSDQFCETNK